MKTTSSFCSLLLIAALGLQGCGDTSPPANVVTADSSVDAARIAEMRNQLEMLKQQAQRVKDANDIKRLQRAYG